MVHAVCALCLHRCVHVYAYTFVYSGSIFSLSLCAFTFVSVESMVFFYRCVLSSHVWLHMWPWDCLFLWAFMCDKYFSASSLCRVHAPKVNIYTFCFNSSS